MDRPNPASEAKFQKLSNSQFLMIAGFGLIGWFYFVRRGEGVEGFLAGLSICAVAGVGTILRRYRDRPSYWITLAVIAVAHALFVLLIHWPPQFNGPGIVFAPLVIADMYASARLVLLVVRKS